MIKGQSSVSDGKIIRRIFKYETGDSYEMVSGKYD